MVEDRSKQGPARARALRLEAELRANLKKRKQQAKARVGSAAVNDDSPEDTSK